MYFVKKGSHLYDVNFSYLMIMVHSVWEKLSGLSSLSISLSQETYIIEVGKREDHCII